MTTRRETIDPVTYKDRNFYYSPNNGYLGDYVSTLTGYTGRIFDCHFTCPESDTWLSMQVSLLPDPRVWKKCRWVSILVHGGGSIVVPEQFVTVIEPFELSNNSRGMYFPLED